MEIIVTLPDGTKIEIKGEGAVDAAQRLIDSAKQAAGGKLDLGKLLKGVEGTPAPACPVPSGLGQLGQYPWQKYYQHGGFCVCDQCRTGTWCGTGTTATATLLGQYQCAA